MSKEIILTQGFVAIVDDEDFETLSKQKWHVKKHTGGLSYACGKIWDKETQKSHNIKMHRVILGLTDPDIIADHVNGNGLDNRRANLRLCTKKENQLNRENRTKNKWKGVSLFRVCRWQSYATDIVTGKKINLGTFDTAEQAALAYNVYAEKNYGKFCKINITSQLG